MSDWAQKLAAAEAAAEGKQAAEHEAESRFDVIHHEAKARGDMSHALESEELKTWMAKRHETDTAWGVWATVMDAKPEHA
ncbi:MAG TPA: hypothetical protein VK996_07670 [Ramlibacter sp.]|nr:hypothetical protein [Ramlibacter sp.]